MCDTNPHHPYRPRSSNEPYCLLCRPVLPSDHSARVFLGVCGFIFLVGGGGLWLLHTLVKVLSIGLAITLVTAGAITYLRWRRRQRLIRVAVPVPVQSPPRTMVTGVTVRALQAANADPARARSMVKERVR